MEPHQQTTSQMNQPPPIPRGTTPGRAGSTGPIASPRNHHSDRPLSPQNINNNSSPQSTYFPSTTSLSPSATPFTPRSPSITLPAHLHVTNHPLSPEAPPFIPRRSQATIPLPHDEHANSSWGDIIDQTTKHCRICLQNINGLQDKAHLLGSQAHHLGIDILGIVETNRDWQTKNTKNQAMAIFRRYWKKTVFAFSSSDHRYRKNHHEYSTYQPGGTCTIVNNTWAARTLASHDPSGMGRWSQMSINGRDNRKVTVFTVYRVCTDTITTAGSQTAYSQQWHMADSRDISPNDPRALLLVDLGLSIAACQQQGHEIIVLMDANEGISTPHSKLAAWVRLHSLCDPLVQRHGDNIQPPTYKRGTTRIDYILTSRHIAEFVSAAGILPYNHLVPSDHKAVFVDVDIQGYLRGQVATTCSTEYRGIQSNNPRAVRKYHQYIKTFLQHSQLEQKVAQFIDIQSNQGHLTASQIEQVISLENSFTLAKLKAEKKCSRLLQIPWSPALKNSMHNVSYWKSWLSQYKTRIDETDYRHRIRPDIPTPTDRPSIETIKRSLHQAKKDQKKSIQNADSLRLLHLQDLATLAANNEKETHCQALKRIIRSEASKSLFQRLKFIMKPFNPHGLNHILLNKNTELPDRPVFDEAAMEHRIQEWNRIHFGQAYRSPFATPFLRNLLGPYGTNEHSQHILDGRSSITKDDVSAATFSIIQKLQRVACPNSINFTITAQELKAAYKNWRESTSTSPSGLHLGHEKAILTKVEKTTLTAMNVTPLDDRIFGIKAAFLNLSVQNRIVYPRWKVVHNTMIEKIPGRPHLNKLRVIHIIESDSNMAMGIYWGRRLMHQAEKLSQFGVEQSGARKNMKCDDVLLFKHITYAILRLSKTNGTTFDNDAKSCYDRIVMLLVSLASQRLGMPTQVCELFQEILNTTQYYAKTVHGTSTLGYGTTPEHFIHGPGQGGRASPSIWTVISCLILSCMSEASNGITLTDPNCTQSIHQSSSGFVDDITHWNINTDQNQAPAPLSIIMQDTQHMAQWWENLLFSTGGKLELSKCFYYVIYWIYDHEGVASMLDTTFLPQQVHLTDSETLSDIIIENKQCHKSHKTLGAMENPSGCYNDEISRLLAKAQSIATKVSCCSIRPHEARIMYQSMYLPSITYSLSAGILNENQAAKIQSPITRTFITLMGFNRTTPTAVAYGPPDQGGVGLRHLFSEQGTKKTQAILQQIRDNTNLGKTLIILFQWAQLVSGIARPILIDTNRRLPHLKDELWIQTHRRFLTLSSMTISIPEIIVPKLKRINDQVLMNIATADSTFSNSDIEKINRCRIFLRAEVLSDVTSADGTTILPSAQSCHPSAVLRTSKQWPKQPQPGPSHVKTWKRFLQAQCRAPQFTLHQPLGAWIETPSQQQWIAYYDSSSDRIHACMDGRWHIYPHHTKHRRYWACNGSPIPSESDKTSLIPLDIIAIHQHSIHVSIPGHITPSTVQTNLAEPNTWNDYVSSLHTWENNLIKNVQHTSTTTLQHILLQATTLFIVSDGSVKADQGTFGWVMASNNEVICTNHGQLPSNSMNSFRAECGGILSWLVLLRHYTKYFRITQSPCTIKPYCDNSTTLAYMSTAPLPWKQARTLRPQYDITNEIRIMFQQLTNTIPFLQPGQHVKSHQDLSDNKTHQEVLNITADALAMAAHRANDRPSPLRLPHCAAALLVHANLIHSNETNLSRWTWRETVLKQYYAGRFNLSLAQLDLIHWHALKSSIANLPPQLHIFTTKLITGWLPIGTRMQRYGNIITKCHRCNQIETMDHLFQCSGREDENKVLVNNLTQFLVSSDTITPIIAAMTQAFQEWLMPHLRAQPLIASNSITHCYNDQSMIGWHLAARGLFCTAWSTLQESNDPNGKHGQWQTKLSSWIIQQAHSIWCERNTEIHQPDDTTSRQEQETQAQIKKLYELAAAKLNIHDRNKIFSETLAERLRRPEASNRIWAKQTYSAVRNAIHRSQDNIGLQDIRNFFQPTGAPCIHRNEPSTASRDRIALRAITTTTQPSTQPNTFVNSRAHQTPSAPTSSSNSDSESDSN
jgi:hypothetical protein